MNSASTNGESPPQVRTPRADVVVVGSGPAGIVAALELADRGMAVVLVESGKRRFFESIQSLSDSDFYDPARHASMRDSTRRQIGGASVIWGGRCVPFDPIDFEPRPYITDATWPVRYSELQPYFAKSAEYFLCGQPCFNTGGIDAIRQKTIVPNLPDGDIRSSDLERWSLPTNFAKEYYDRLRANKRITLLDGLTCVQLCTDDAATRVETLRCKYSNGQEVHVAAGAVVLACGGLESTRLLMVSNRRNPAGLGNASGLLGRYYMGHISGRIAHAHFSGDPRRTVYAFLRDGERVYLRQRFTFSDALQRRERLTNIAMWLVNPVIGDPSHRNGVMSIAYLILRSPLGRYLASSAMRKAAIYCERPTTITEHIANIIRDLPSALSFIPSFGVKRFVLRRKVPGFFQYSRANSYPLHYHGEQTPNLESRVWLSEKRDALGMQRLNIDLRYSDKDVDAVVRAHQLLDEYLRRHGAGRLEYLGDDLHALAWHQAADGFHQAGTTRMSDDPADGVVDRNCRVHGIENLFVASSSVFVTSSQANSTFMVVVFAIRLAEHLAKQAQTTPSCHLAGCP